MNHSKLKILRLGLCALFLLSCSAQENQSNQEPSAEQTSVLPPAEAASLKVHLTSVAKAFRSPVHLTAPLTEKNKLYVIEQPGIIQLVENGKKRSAPFLNIQERVKSGGEMGLLSMAFHPQYAQNGRVFTNYTHDSGKLETRISEFKANPATQVADPQSEKILMTIEQPFENHNGGQIAFGLDGYLYIGMGDGGSGGDPF